MKKYTKFIVCAFFTLSVITVTNNKQASAYSIHSFDPQVVYSGNSAAQLAALDAAVGTTGYAIESFEGVALQPGLSQLNGSHPISGNFQTWDGSAALRHLGTDPTLQFDFSFDLVSFGIGIIDLESDVRVVVNDTVDLGLIRDLPNFTHTSGGNRDVYIRIDQEVGDIAITQIRFESLDGLNDTVYYDRMAFQTASAVSAPSAVLVFGLGAAALFIRKRRPAKA